MKIGDFLLPGDVLLYRPKGLFGWIILLKTWHRVGHVEVYVGSGESVASRDKVGVGRFPLRTNGLFKVCRPKEPFDLAAALEWFETVNGEPYGFLDLVRFVGIPVDGPGRVCSSFAVTFQRKGGVNGFNGEPANNVAPFQFDVSPTYRDYEVKDGYVIAPDVVGV